MTSPDPVTFNIILDFRVDQRARRTEGVDARRTELSVKEMNAVNDVSERRLCKVGVASRMTDSSA